MSHHTIFDLHYHVQRNDNGYNGFNGGDLQPGCLADRLLTGLGQPQINP